MKHRLLRLFNRLICLVLPHRWMLVAVEKCSNGDVNRYCECTYCGKEHMDSYSLADRIM